MKKAGSLHNGIPIAPSLNPTLQSESIAPRAEQSKKRLLTISLFAFIVAVLSSVIAKPLIDLIYFITNLCFYGVFSFAHATPVANTLGAWVIIIPAAGGVIVGFMALYGSKAIRGHGIPEAMEQILTNQSKIKPALTYLKPLSSAVSIGTGGPFGAEGPIIATGGALGSTIGQIVKISNNERKILLASGATAGMSAIFGTPVAAMFLAVELLLFEFSPRSLVPVAIACMVGDVGHHLFFGQGAVFEMGTVASPGTTAILICGLIGLIIGILSVLTSKTVYWIEAAFEKMPVHWMWWPAIGGVAVGIVGYFSPRTLGVGYENITDVLSGNLPVQMVASLCILKFISWAIALGSGTSGGTLAPLLTIGGAAGSLLGVGLIYLFPSAGVTVPLAALVGMAAMFSGASRALLTSIIFALESTAQINALLPLLVACVVAYIVSFFLMEYTIMTEKIARRGVRTPQSYKPDVLERIKVEQVVNNEGVVLSEDNTVGEVCDWLSREQGHRANFFIVSNEQGAYKGILNASDLFNDYRIPDRKIGTLVKSRLVSVQLQDTLRLAAEIMAQESIDVLPVLSDSDKNIVGIVSYRDILTAYKHEFDEYERKRPNISWRRNGLKILLQGQKLLSPLKWKR